MSEQKRIAEIPFGELVTGNVRWEPLPRFDGSLLLARGDKTKILSSGKKAETRPKKRFKKLYNNAAVVSRSCDPGTSSSGNS